MQINRSHRQELIVYVVLWASLFIAPIISIQIHHQNTEAFPWNELWEVWKQMGFILIAFLLHNYILAPLLVYKQKRLLYFSCIFLLTVCFAVVQCVDRPNIDRHGPRPDMMHEHPRMAQEPESDRDFEPMEPRRHDFHPRDHKEFKPGKPLLVFSQHDVIATIILILMMGMNIGVKLYFKQRHDQQRLMQLEKENLHQQLEYLRYQINPHFLMNTLNNIHALVDIDGERAKETIVELSKIMRFALYEGSRQTVPLNRDVAFMQSYIKLMSLRYTEKVNINVDIPQQLPDCNIPPMLFITFVENAFKHGVSYQQQSFVNISLNINQQKIVFNCSNSKVQREESNPSEGGVGLQNVQRRLQLIYGNTYKLHIDNGAETYNITLEIPLSV